MGVAKFFQGFSEEISLRGDLKDVKPEILTRGVQGSEGANFEKAHSHLVFYKGL